MSRTINHHIHRTLLWALALLVVSVPGYAQAVKEVDFAPRQSAIDALKPKILSGADQLNIYALGKAQCWVNFAKHEWHRNDASNVAFEALTQADELLESLNQGKAVNLETRMIDNTQRIRTDLWQQAQAIKQMPYYRCSAAATACVEVLLVQAAHNQAQLGWRYANPYVGMAEDMLGYAQKQASQCVVPEAAKPVVVAQAPAAIQPAPASVEPVKPVVPTPLPVVALVQASQITIDASALFKFDQHSLGQMLPEGKAQIEAAAKKLASFKKVLAIKLVGHTDRLGSVAYNDKLSQRRVETVKQYLVSLGVDTQLITTAAKGKSEQIVVCESSRFKSHADLKACLQPNRRVVIRFLVEQ